MTYELEQMDGSVKLTVTHEMEKKGFNPDWQGVEWVAAYSIEPEELAGDGGAAGVDAAVAEEQWAVKGQ